MLEKLVPRLEPNATVRKDDKAFICAGDYSSQINDWAEEAILMFDGTKSVEEITAVLAGRYPKTSKDEIRDRIENLIIVLWKQGLYLNHNIDSRMAILLYGADGFAFFPNFCRLPKLNLYYIDPTYKRSYLSDSEIVAIGLAEAVKIIGKYDAEGNVVSLVVLQKTPCCYSFSIIAIYGCPLSHSDYVGVKKCLCRCLENDSSGTRENMKYVFLFTQLTPPDVHKANTWLPEICHLEKELGEAGMSIVKMEL